MLKLNKSLIDKLTNLDKKGYEENVLIEAIMDTLSVQRKQARRYLKYYYETYSKGTTLPAELAPARKQASVSFSNDDGIAESIQEDIRTLQQLLDVCKVDTNIWEVDKYTVNKWEQASKSEKGDFVTVTPLFQVKAFLKKRKGLDDAKALADFFKNEVASITPKHFVPRAKKNGKYMLEISVPDLHLGKLAWGEETGFDNYDSKEAVKLFEDAVLDLIGKAPIEDIDTILLPVGNDFFNVDNHNSTTTAGTPQSEDSRWQKTFTMGCKLLTDVVEYLSTIATVQVVIVQGNHDYERSFYLGEYLSAWFRNATNISVDNSPTIRKYFMYGKNLIGFTHGNEEKLANLPLTMATEAKEEWAKTEFREIHLGHMHTEQLKEIQGVKVRHLPSLCSTDAWHAKKGYIGNLRSAQAYLYSPTRGVEAIYYHNV